MGNEVRELLTVADVAKRAGITPDGVRYWVVRGALHPAFRTPSGISLFEAADVEVFLAQRGPAKSKPAGLGVVASAHLQTCEAAREVGITPRALRMAVRDGRLPATQTRHGQYLFRAEDVASFAQARRGVPRGE